MTPTPPAAGLCGDGGDHHAAAAEDEDHHPPNRHQPLWMPRLSHHDDDDPTTTTPAAAAAAAASTTMTTTTTAASAVASSSSSSSSVIGGAGAYSTRTNGDDEDDAMHRHGDEDKSDGHNRSLSNNSSSVLQFMISPASSRQSSLGSTSALLGGDGGGGGIDDGDGDDGGVGADPSSSPTMNDPTSSGYISPSSSSSLLPPYRESSSGGLTAASTLSVSSSAPYFPVSTSAATYVTSNLDLHRGMPPMHPTMNAAAAHRDAAAAAVAAGGRSADGVGQGGTLVGSARGGAGETLESRQPQQQEQQEQQEQQKGGWRSLFGGSKYQRPVPPPSSSSSSRQNLWLAHDLNDDRASASERLHDGGMTMAPRGGSRYDDDEPPDFRLRDDDDDREAARVEHQKTKRRLMAESIRSHVERKEREKRRQQLRAAEAESHARAPPYSASMNPPWIGRALGDTKSSSITSAPGAMSMDSLAYTVTDDEGGGDQADLAADEAAGDLAPPRSSVPQDRTFVVKGGPLTTEPMSPPPPRRIVQQGYNSLSPITPPPDHWNHYAHRSRSWQQRGGGGIDADSDDSIDAVVMAGWDRSRSIAERSLPLPKSATAQDAQPPHAPSLTNDSDGGGGGESAADNKAPSAPPPPTDDGPETVHAQSLVLALAFLAAWSPQNLMAPNLTQMATDFNFSPAQRDLYLGANLAFATGVLSLPVSGLIGFLADVVPSRRDLYAGTVLAGGIAAICTGLSETYSALYFARFLNGGFMSGCVPVAFSLLGDLFEARDRNAASSALTSMMGTGIIAGQVYAGVVGDEAGWRQPFFLSGSLSVVTSILVWCFVREPVRGGKERVLQDMLARGTKYDRKLTLQGFVHAMLQNRSNFLLMWQGFFANIPWGVIFVFLNDYLSQEQGLSVPDATFLVFVFGIGCAAGGVLGGYWGQQTMQIDRRYLPLFMSVTTFLGIGPFLGMLDGSYNSASLVPCFYAFTGGCIANLPSVNVRPCLLNVNPPEVRGAALTAANLIINFARGAGPGFLTMMSAIWGVERGFSFNVLIIFFWSVTAVLLALLAGTLPKDQDTMEAELANYAELALKNKAEDGSGGAGTTSTYDTTDGSETLVGGDESIVSIEDRITSFDSRAARESLQFMGDAFREIGGELRHLRHSGWHGSGYEPIGENGGEDDGADVMNGGDRRRKQWRSQQLMERGGRYGSTAPTRPMNGKFDWSDGHQAEDVVQQMQGMGGGGTSVLANDGGAVVVDMDRGKKNQFSGNLMTML